MHCLGHGVASKMAAQPSERGSQHQQRMQLLVPSSVLADLARAPAAPAATWADHWDVLLVLAAASFMQVIAMLFVPTELALPPTTARGSRQVKREGRGSTGAGTRHQQKQWLRLGYYANAIHR